MEKLGLLDIAYFLITTQASNEDYNRIISLVKKAHREDLFHKSYWEHREELFAEIEKELMNFSE